MTTAVPPDLERLRATWDSLAAVDPFWAVLSSAEHRLGGWNRERFFATGREEIDELIAEIRARGLRIERGVALDFGCGVGRLSRGLARHFDSVIGVDLSSRMVDWARDLTPEGNVRYLVNPAGDLALLAGGSIDFLYTGRVLQHVPPKLTLRCLSEFVRVLAPDGLAVFQLPSAIRGGRPEDAALTPDACRAELILGEMPAQCVAGEMIEIEVTVRNRSCHDWPGVADLGLFQLRVGNHWRHADGRPERCDDGRTPLGGPLPAGDERMVRVRMAAPSEPGDYELEMDLVQELVTWFADRGSPTARRPLRVLPGGAGAGPDDQGPDRQSWIEMHTLPRHEVERVIEAAGGRLVHSRYDGLAGPEWESTTYFITRRRASWIRRWWDRTRGMAGATLTLAVLAAGGAACSDSRPSSPAPHHGYRGANLLLISIDTLRADRLSAYGHARRTSPHLESLAAAGVVFERFYYNGGGTLPSHMSMLTSLYPGTHGLDPGRTKSLEPERVTLAEALRTAGYATAGYADSGYMQAKWGFDQGFDIYDDTGQGFAGILPRARAWFEDRRRRRGDRDQPFFLFLHTYDVHSQSRQLPYECPGDYPFFYTGGPHSSFTGCRGGRCASDLLASVNADLRERRTTPAAAFTKDELEFVSSLYDGCINYVDDRIREVLGWLDEYGVGDKTIVVVTSDHGEEFLDHGYLLHDQGGYEELARLPLLIRLPDRAYAGSRVPHLAEMVDLMPTVLDLLALPVPVDAQGSSLVPTFRDDLPVTEAVHMYSILRTDRFKYFKDERLLFDLDLDPGEKTNLHHAADWRSIRMHRQVRAMGRSDFRAAAEFAARASSTQPVLMSPEERDRLRSLGYLR